MVVLITTVDDNSPAAVAFVQSVRDSGVALGDEFDAYRDRPAALIEWRIRAVPCLAYIHQGVAVHQVTAPEALATFEADAQAAAEAYDGK